MVAPQSAPLVVDWIADRLVVLLNKIAQDLDVVGHGWTLFSLVAWGGRFVGGSHTPARQGFGLPAAKSAALHNMECLP